MTLEQIRDLVLQHQKTIATLDEWAEAMERRMSVIEKHSDLLTKVQITLERINASNNFFAEKLNDMKLSLEAINSENKIQHTELSTRVRKIEDQPGEKWNKATWVIITAFLMAAAAFITNQLNP